MDRDDLLRVYDQEAVRLRAWLRSETGLHEVATDLTAETFAQALVSLRRFRGSSDEEATAWLYGIARNLLGQYRRRDRVDQAARRRLGIPLRDWSEYEDVDDRASVDPRLAAALTDLPADERSALHLRVVDELSYDDVASHLAITPGAARMRVHRALRTLGLRLKGHAA
jgi:RNA polymerase sigma-70 factor (ECF subfamily)